MRKGITPAEKRTVYTVCIIIVVITIVMCAGIILSVDFFSEPSSAPQSGSQGTGTEEVIAQDLDFPRFYRAYKENELVANEEYKYNRYRVTAKINGMETGGLLNLTGGATLTMTNKVDNTIVVFLAEFEKEQEEALKTVKVGDTITFEGMCLGAGNWSECELIVE